MFSNYLISPARSSYNKVFDATTIAFVALHALLRKPAKLTKLSDIADRLLPSSTPSLTNQFLLDRDRDGGALYQKLRHAQILNLERTADHMKKSRDHNEEANNHLKILSENREARISKLNTNPAPFSQTDWAEEIDKTTNTLVIYLDLFKPDKDVGKQVYPTKIPHSSIQGLLSSS